MKPRLPPARKVTHKGIDKSYYYKAVRHGETTSIHLYHDEQHTSLAGFVTVVKRKRIVLRLWDCVMANGVQCIRTHIDGWTE